MERYMVLSVLSACGFCTSGVYSTNMYNQKTKKLSKNINIFTHFHFIIKLF
jgi:hypothetical protein